MKRCHFCYLLHTTLAFSLLNFSSPLSLPTPISGPGALLQSCTIEDFASVGAGAIVLEGALVERGARVGDGAVVHPGRRIPAGQLWEGNPAVYARDLTKTELAEAEGHANEAADLAQEHSAEFLPYTTAYNAAETLGVDALDKSLVAIKAKHAERMVQERELPAGSSSGSSSGGRKAGQLA